MASVTSTVCSGWLNRNRPGSGSVARWLPVVLLLCTGALQAAGKDGEDEESNEVLRLDSGPRQLTLLELYTSQGCSSCPPAERWLNRYVDSKDLWTRVVPVAFHVDYWDYIGWKDSYARPEFGERQREYARRGLAHTVYTPGLFANGKEWRGWTLRSKPPVSRDTPGNLSVEIGEEVMHVKFDNPARKKYHLNIALLGFDIATRVKRGENRNSTLQQEFVVLAFEQHLSGTGNWHLVMPRSEHQAARYGLALWVTRPGSQVPVQAAGGWLDPAGDEDAKDGVAD